MNALQRVRSVLEQEDYHVKGFPEIHDELAFRNPSVFGFVCVFESPQAILEHWRERQQRFLTKNAIQLQSHPEMAWNAYAVFLTESRAQDEQEGKLIRIEEDFAGARKIARANITTREAVERALLPLLPLRHTAAIQPVDLAGRLEADRSIDGRIREGLLQRDSGKRITARLLEDV